MTKAEVARLVRRARQYGYYHSGRTMSADCPRCRERQATDIGYRYFPAPEGKPANVDPVTGKRTIYRIETPIEALDRTMSDHVANWCGALTEDAV